MKKINHKQKIQQQLSQNYGILHLLLKREEFSSLKYQQLMYILQNGRIQMSNIAYFKKQIYKDEQPLMRRSFIIKDGIKLREDIIQKVWRFQRMQKRSSIKQSREDKSSQPIDRQRSKTQAIYQQNQQQQNQKQPKINSPEQKQIPRSTQKQNNYPSTKQQRIIDKNRKNQIQQQLMMLQGKMNITHNEQQAADYQKQYKRLYKQLTYLRNKYRIDRQNRLIKQITHTNQSHISKQVKQILQKMKQTKSQNCKILHKQSQYKQKISKVQQITRLNKIFEYYCKKLTQSPSKYFSDHKSQPKLNLQTFIKFCQDWNIMRIITIQQIVNIFKSHRKKTKNIDNIQFAQILIDIHKCQCIKQGKPINNQSISQYIQEYIVLDHKINRILYGLDVSRQKNKNKSEYRYKPKSHSGKYIQDIKQQLKNRKKTIDFLAGPQNVVKFNQRRANSRNVSINTFQNYQIMRTRQANYNQNPNNTSVISSLNDSINSYAFRFKLKNVKNRVKTEGIIKTLENTKAIYSKKNHEVIMQSNRQNINNRSQSQAQNDNELNDLIDKQQIEKHDTQNLISKNQQIPKKKTILFEGFEDLIEQSQQDEYLNKHLLPPIQPKRGLSNHIHY